MPEYETVMDELWPDDAVMTCVDCGDQVNPKDGDKRAAVVVEGAVDLLCAPCGRESQRNLRNDE